MVLGNGNNNVVEIFEDDIGLVLGDALDGADKAGVVEEGFPASDGVGADEGVFCCDWGSADWMARLDGALGLFVGRVEGSEGFEVDLHGARDGIVGGVAGGPESVTSSATRWAREELEGGVGGWLLFVGYVRVPEVAERGEVLLGFGVFVGPDDVNVRESWVFCVALWNSSGGMGMELAKVSTESKLVFHVKVLLVSEEDDTSVGNKTGKVVLLSIGKVLKLDSGDLSSNLG